MAHDFHGMDGYSEYVVIGFASIGNSMLHAESNAQVFSGDYEEAEGRILKFFPAKKWNRLWTRRERYVYNNLPAI